MFDFSGGYGGYGPIKRRGPFQGPGDAPPPTLGEAPPSFLDSGAGGDGSADSPIVVGGDPSLQLSGIQPRRNKFQSFLGGLQGGHGLMGGLAGLSGQGGMAGRIGGAAKFLL